ncbi:MAG TPA: hypothetical protein VKQ30_04500 [Ktedonobacterales bacterium]|nr:hypothetical protein [Ktedonobacterales bacterium]
MSSHTTDSRRRRATPQQIARAMRRGSAPPNLRPRPPMPHTPASTRAGSSLSIEPVDPTAERAVPLEEPVRRWGPALFFQQGMEDADQEGFGWISGLRERLPRRSPYAWNERDWRMSAVMARIRVLPVVAAILIALLVVGAFAVVIASHAASGAANQLHSASSVSSPTASSGGLILQQRPAGAPTPAAPAYTIGTWATSYAPASGGVVQVYVRVSKDADPVKGIAVTLTVSFSGGGSTYGPVRTDAYGLASFQVSVSAGPGQPEFVTASITVGGSSYTADTIFVPVGGGTGSTGSNPNGKGHHG